MYLAMNQKMYVKPAAKKSYRKKEWILRLIATPLFALIIDHATPLVSYETDPLQKIIFTYAYTTLISYLLWTGNALLLRRMRKSNLWLKSPAIKILFLLAIHLAFSFLFSYLLFTCWHAYITGYQYSTKQLLLASLIATIISLLVTILYELLTISVERKIDLQQAEKLKSAKLHAELESLKSQIDPHFIFNSLNTLAGLINNNPGKALQFNENLGIVYRYIISNRSKDLVTVQEEMEFLNSYIFLIKIRFENAVHIIVSTELQDSSAYLIPTIAIQTGLENAIKHNQFSENCPLTIFINLTNDYVIVSNKSFPLTYTIPSTGQGLVNLGNRYQFILNQSIHIDETEDSFTLYLPIIKKTV